MKLMSVRLAVEDHTNPGDVLRSIVRAHEDTLGGCLLVTDHFSRLVADTSTIESGLYPDDREERELELLVSRALATGLVTA